MLCSEMIFKQFCAQHYCTQSWEGSLQGWFETIYRMACSFRAQLRSAGLSIVCVRICWNCWHGRWLSEISELTRAMCYAKLPAGMPTVEITLQRKRFTNIGSHQMVENGSNMNTNVLGQYLISFDMRASLYFYLQAYAYQSCANQYNITLP